MDAIPLLGTVLSLAGAVLFALVGRTVHRRQVSPEAHSAQLAFVVFWYGLAGVTLVGALLSLSGSLFDVGMMLVVTFVLLVVLCAAMAGLLHYLVFLYTSRNLLPYILAGYGAYFVLLVAYILLNGPSGIESTRWGPSLEYSHPLDGGPLYWVVLVLLIAPPVLSAGAYLSLYRLTHDRMLRRRILLVSTSIIVWFGSSLIGTAPGAQETDWYRIASRLISLAAAGVVLYAYTRVRPTAPAATHSAPQAGHDKFFDPPQGNAAHVRRVARPLTVPSLV